MDTHKVHRLSGHSPGNRHKRYAVCMQRDCDWRTHGTDRQAVEAAADQHEQENEQ